MARAKDIGNKFSVSVIGEHDKLSGFEKAAINDELLGFVGSFADTFSEGVLVADISFNKGRKNEGKYRGLPLVYFRIRFSTDKGLFVAKKENWGVSSSLNDTLEVLDGRIRESLQKKLGKDKTHTSFSERKMVET